MKSPTKFVQPLTAQQREQLQGIMRSSVSYRKRIRAHAVLLSERRYSIDHIAGIYQVDRDRVSNWLDRWAQARFDGLEDSHRSGRPRTRRGQE
jgi:transposase